MTRKKYFKSKAEANKACAARNEAEHTYLFQVFRMPKGSRHPGQYAVCTYLDYVNTY